MGARVIAGWCAGLSLLATLVSPSSGAAAELSIATPAACAVADELTFRTERALGQPIESAAAVRCTIHIARSAGMYAARMEVESIGSGRPSRFRSFLAPTCEKLTETLALAVVLAIGAGPDDVSAGAAGAEPSARPPEAASEAGAAPLAGTASSAGLAPHDASGPAPAGGAEVVAHGPAVAVGAALVADAGSLPGTGLGVSLAAALGWSIFELRLLGTYLPGREASLATSSGSGGADIGLLAGSASGCLPRLLRAAPIELGACAGAELGGLDGTGTGVDVSRSARGSWFALRADAGARWELGGGVRLDLLLSALVPAERHEFTISGLGPVFRPAAVAGRASLGASFVFGSSGSRAR